LWQQILESTVLPWVVLAACLAATCVVSANAVIQAQVRARQRFGAAAEAVRRELEERMAVPAQVLRGAAGLFAASDHVGGEEWRRYYGSLDLAERQPGIKALGYIEPVLHTNLHRFLAEARADSSPYHAPSEFSVWPETNQAVHYLVKYVEPFAPNRRALGYDIASDPVRRRAAAEACENATAVLTRRIRLVQSPDSPGALLLLPIYRTGVAPESPPLRWSTLQGWVYAAFVMDELFGGLGARENGAVHFEVYDGPAVHEANLLYRSGDRSPESVAAAKPRFSVTNAVILERRQWTLRCCCPSGFFEPGREPMPQRIAAGGVGVSLLAFGAAWALANSRRRAVTLAAKMTGKLRVQEDILRASNRELSASRERLALVVQGSNDGVWDWDIASSRVYFSPRWKSMLGYEDHELENVFFTWERLIHPEDYERALRTVRDTFGGHQTSYELEHRLRHKDGGYRWVLARGVLLRDARGRPVRMAGSHVDLTERRQAVELLQAEYAAARVLAEAGSLPAAGPPLLRALGEHLHWDCGLLWLLDPAAKVLRVAACWQAEEPELRAFVLHSQTASLAREEGLPGAAWARARPVWAADAAALSEEPRSEVIAHAGLRSGVALPLQTGDQFLGVIECLGREPRAQNEALARTLSAIAAQTGLFVARCQAEEARGRLAAIIESSNDAVYGENLKGVITSWNPAAERIFGYSAAEILGQPTSLFVPPDRLNEFAAMREKVRRGEPVNNAETVRMGRRGSLRLPVSLTLSPIKDSSGKLTGISAIARDNTERHKAEEELRSFAAQLEQSNRDLEEFAFVASHDLQEPLGKVQAFAELLERECAGQLSLRGADYLRRLTRATLRMHDLIAALLTYARVQSQAQPFGLVDLDKLLAETLTDMDDRVRQTGAQVDIQSLGVLEGDATQLRQLFQNLLGNALKFTRPGVAPRIRVWRQTATPGEAEQPGPAQERCQVAVQDNGIGIEAKYRDRLFGMFQRLNPPHLYPGSGMGLAICRRIVLRHGGSIHVQSEPGQGATFIVTLPARHSHKEGSPCST